VSRNSSSLAHVLGIVVMETAPRDAMSEVCGYLYYKVRFGCASSCVSTKI
jgi:hypothetical protein